MKINQLNMISEFFANLYVAFLLVYIIFFPLNISSSIYDVFWWLIFRKSTYY